MKIAGHNNNVRSVCLNFLLFPDLPGRQALTRFRRADTAAGGGGPDGFGPVRVSLSIQCVKGV